VSTLPGRPAQQTKESKRSQLKIVNVIEEIARLRRTFKQSSPCSAGESSVEESTT
jgi:hypothetical protein